ncbi:hypothetical protein [Gottfriedia solisilvae]|uniref:Uncharacterized protein n=1 Tax=Gottfriedia solisilvae TaxID=1516104 RepID=A0A8J3AQA1_9BACI|nr:hypothetical protein [Gottfriedia solisilvae]GGI17995.1 hypothetical protein GCM10007380_40720 [Gottfriedia solisilvae]
MRNFSYEELQKRLQNISSEVDNQVRDFSNLTVDEEWSRKRTRARTLDEQKALDFACRGYIRNLMKEGKIIYINTPGERRMKIDGL